MTLGNVVRWLRDLSKPGMPAKWQNVLGLWWVQGQYRIVRQKPDNHREHTYHPPLGTKD